MALWILCDTDENSHKSVLDYHKEISTIFKKRRIDVHQLKSPKDYERIFKDEQAVVFVCEEIDGKNIQFIKKCNTLNIPIISRYTSANTKEYHCNYISSDLQDCIQSVITYLNAYRKKRIAFFGIKNSNSDISKLQMAFSLHKELEKSDVFAVTESFEKSFEDFFNQREKYDAIICANDIVAVWLFEKLMPLDEKYAKNTLLMSFMNSVLANVYHHTITSCSIDKKLFLTQVLNLYRMLCKERSDQISVEVRLKGKIFIRQSTKQLAMPKRKTLSMEYCKCTEDILKQISQKGIVEDETINFLFKLETFLCNIDVLDLEIIHLFLLNMSNDEVARKMFISVQTIKNRSAIMFRKLGVKGKKDFINIISKYVQPVNLEKYIKDKQKERKKSV